MTNVEKWADRYNKQWCTEAQLKQLVGLGVLTSIDYEEITGEMFES